MKKVLVFLGVVIVLFAGLAFLTNNKTEEKSSAAKAKYGDKELHPETVAQLDDPNYQNIITLGDLEDKLAEEEEATVYFYSPTCPHCKKATPILMPLAEEMGIEIDQLNVLEYDSAWDQFKIEGTPTLIHFKNGKETARVAGGMDKEQYKNWLSEHAE